MKAYTDLEQSKRLAEILPIESADMWYHGHNGPMTSDMWFDNEPAAYHSLRPNWDMSCWSLAALLNTFPKGEYKDVELCFGGYQGDKYIPEWCCYYEQQEPFIIEACYADNPVDACYEMILKLHELNLL